jgi:hypothetical protein
MSIRYNKQIILKLKTQSIMKKLIVSVFVCFLAFSTVSNASTKNEETLVITSKVITGYNVSTFCKLIQMGNYDAVKALIDSGENVNKKSNGLTPLMFAARHNKAKIAKLLISNGAKVKTKSDKGNMTALQIAKRSKAVDAIKVIKEAV